MRIESHDSTRGDALQAVRLLSDRCAQAGGDPAAVLGAIRAAAEQVFGARAAALRLLAHTRELVPVGEENAGGALAGPRPVSLDEWPSVARTVADGDVAPALDPPARVALRTPVAVPLGTAGEVLGVLLVEATRGDLGDDARDLLRTFGAVGGLALAGALEHERAVRLSDLKSQFIALAAHELRAPFAVMQGIITTLHHRDDLPAEHELSLRDALIDQTERMTRLIDQLLDLSRLDANTIPIERRRFRVRECLEDVVSLVAGERQTEVRLEVPPDLVVEADSAAVERIVANLVANALRHGKPPVTIAARQRDTHFRLSVEDRGGGVDGSFVPRLFDRFSRSRSSSGTNGTGLGLAIAQSYAQAHGGELVYSSAEPHGARFELVLPRSPHGEVQDATAADRSASSTSSA